MNLREEAIRGAAWSAVEGWGYQLVSLGVFVILSRLLDPSDFGLVALAMVFVAFAQILVEQGLGDAIVQRDGLKPAHVDAAFWASVVAGSVVALAGVASAGPVSSLLGNPEIAGVLRWLSLTFLVTGFSGVQRAMLRRQLAFRSLAIRLMGSVIAGGIVGIGMAMGGYGVWSLVGQNLTAAIVGVLLLWRVSSWRPRFRFSRSHFQDLFGYGATTAAGTVFMFLWRRGDDFLIGVFLGPVALGFYVIAYGLVQVMLRLMTSTINAVAFPVFSHMQRDTERMRRAFYQATTFSAALAVPAFVGLAVIAPDITDAVFGAKWAESVPVMRVLAWVGVISSVTHFNMTVIRAMGKASWRLAYEILAAALTVAGFAIAVHWGIVAVAAAFVFSRFLLAPVSLHLVRRLIGIEYRAYFQGLVPVLLASVIMAVGVAIIESLLPSSLSSAWSVVISIGVGILTYLSALALIAYPLLRTILSAAASVLPRQRVSSSADPSKAT